MKHVVGQLSMFGGEVEKKTKSRYSIYAVPRSYDGNHLEAVIWAYSEAQARFLFYKDHADYMITGIYEIKA